MKNKLLKQLNNEDFHKNLVNEVLLDFEKRQQKRKSLEAQWQLNMNYLMGNQYCALNSSGDVEDYEKQFFWQEREVFNQIAPIMEARNSKLNKIRPKVTVVPFSNEDNDIKTAKVSKKILDSVSSSINLSGLVEQATRWSEICGTCFYKPYWNKDIGQILAEDEMGNKIYSGDIDIMVCPPYEIYPEDNCIENIQDQRSIIHAKVYDVDDVKKIWNQVVEPKEINVISLESVSSVGGLGYNSYISKVINETKSNSCIVLEKYEQPSSNYPNGRLIIVAGDKLLYLGELPYVNPFTKKREFPFVKQTSVSYPGMFWGTSIIERIIPLQRAYNAVKNRKHEYLNRVTMGIMTVEDGSIDTDNLEDEGLSPGKVIVYRQGSNPPSILNNMHVPTDFTLEEQRLLEEFTYISGTSDFSRSSSVVNGNMSGVALQILVEQDDNRISISSDSIKNAIKEVSKFILKLYKQFALIPRTTKLVGENGSIEVFYFNESDISSDDIIFEAQTEVGETLAQRRNTLLDLYKNGLLSDENGKISNRMRQKALELLGFGMWEGTHDLTELHIKKAEKENLSFLKEENIDSILEVDDHDIHIDEHTAFLLSSTFEKLEENKEKVKQKILKHIRQHKQMKSLLLSLENSEVNNGNE